MIIFSSDIFFRVLWTFYFSQGHQRADHHLHKNINFQPTPELRRLRTYLKFTTVYFGFKVNKMNISNCYIYNLRSTWSSLWYPLYRLENSYVCNIFNLSLEMGSFRSTHVQSFRNMSKKSSLIKLLTTQGHFEIYDAREPKSGTKSINTTRHWPWPAHMKMACRVVNLLLERDDHFIETWSSSKNWRPTDMLYCEGQRKWLGFAWGHHQIGGICNFWKLLHKEANTHIYFCGNS